MMRRRKGEERPPRRERARIPLGAKLLMLIGLLTVIYFFITYALIPLLAMMTVS